jgi:CO/xanthine dehydrogenase FAD-binding subunit
MEYRVADTLKEAFALLSDGKNPRPIAGGTDLAVVLADGLIAPEALVDISSIPGLRGIHASASGISIGAATTIAEIASRTEDLPACLTSGARSIGSPQIRNLATIGGNICNASPCGDTLPGLVALDAVFVLASAAGTRRVAAEEFFLGPKKTVLGTGELLVEIRIDALHLKGSSSFRMIGKRNGQAISQVNAAVWLLLERGSVRAARAAVGSVAPVPLRLRKTEALLMGATRGSLDVARVLACVGSEISPISDVRASVEYRRLVTASLFKECLLEAMDGPRSTAGSPGGA